MEESIFSLLGREKQGYYHIVKAFEGIPEKYQILLIENLNDRSLMNLELIKFLMDKNYEIFYVTMNWSADEILKSLNEKNIETNKLKIVDMITRQSSGKEIQSENVKYLNSSKDLIELSDYLEGLMHSLKNEKKTLIFDSVTSLAVYNPAHISEKFIHTLVSKMRNNKVKGIIIAGENTDKEIIAATSQFCDKVVRI